MENEPSFLIIENKRATPSGFLGDTLSVAYVFVGFGVLSTGHCAL